jgi:hypothetical protein
VEHVTISFGTPLVILHQLRPQQIAVMTLTVGNFSFEGVSITMPGQAAGQAVSQHSSASMTAGSMGTVQVAWKDSSGNTVKVDGPTTWNSTDESIVQITGQSSNPLISNIYAPGPLGTAQVHANADADLGQGVQPVTAILDITVIGGQAVGGEITFTPTGEHPPSPGGPGRGTPPRGR